MKREKVAEFSRNYLHVEGFLYGMSGIVVLPTEAIGSYLSATKMMALACKENLRRNSDEEIRGMKNLPKVRQLYSRDVTGRWILPIISPLF